MLPDFFVKAFLCDVCEDLRAFQSARSAGKNAFPADERRLKGTQIAQSKCEPIHRITLEELESFASAASHQATCHTQLLNYQSCVQDLKSQVSGS